MIKNEKYINFLKSIIACVSYGDYYSIKELSKLELEHLQKREKEDNDKVKSMRKFFNQYKNTPIIEWESKELLSLMNIYSYYIGKTINYEIMSFEEFIDKAINYM